MLILIFCKDFVTSINSSRSVAKSLPFFPLCHNSTETLSFFQRRQRETITQTVKLHPLTFSSWLTSAATRRARQKSLVINFQSLMVLLSAPGYWINKNLIAPLNHLKVIPLRGTFNIISNTSGWFWVPSDRTLPWKKAWSASFALNSDLKKKKICQIILLSDS